MLMKKKDGDYLVRIFVGKRIPSKWKIKGYDAEVSTVADSPKTALRQVADMLIADTHLWGRK